MAAVSLIFAATFACGPAPYAVPDGATAGLYTPDAELHTFPDDFHTVDDGRTATGLRVDIGAEAEAAYAEGLPEGFSVIEALEDLDGFGTTAPITLRFTAPLDPATADGAVRLVRLDDGADVPIELAWTDEGATLFVSPSVPLAPATRYGVVVTGDVRDAAGAPVYAAPALRVLLAGRTLDRRLLRLQPRYASLLAATGLSADDVVAATVFTTQSLGGDDAAIVAAVADYDVRLAPAGDCTADGALRRCEAEVVALDFLGEDDVVDLAPGELPVSERVYTIPVTVWLPADVAAPLPVVLYGHGLGGRRDNGGGFAETVVPLGFAVAAIDAPAHGEHPASDAGSEFASILEFFGIDVDGLEFRVDRLRDHFRQAAWDKLQVVKALRAGADLDGDGEGDLDGRVAYAGHSLGAIMGPQLLALDPDVLAADLSVPGARVAEIVQDGQTFGPLVTMLTPEGVGEGDVDRFFPLVQAAVERGDPGNYAGAVLDGRRDVLVQMVIDDLIVPNPTTAFLAHAMGLPQADPVLLDLGVEPAGAPPIAGNVGGRTAVLYQYAWLIDEETGELAPAAHDFAHHEPISNTQVAWFWQTWREHGLAEVIDPFEATGTERPE